jgi:glycine/D-amino acid oxidase-like deaminating enzyme
MTSYTARRTPLHRGPAAWSAILPEQDASVELNADVVADVVIIGGGFAGLSAGRRLLQLAPKSKIIVLEAGRIAEGASGRNSGFMIDLPHELSADGYMAQGVNSDSKMIALNRKAIGFGKAAVEDYGIAPTYFDQVGKVNGAVGAKGDQHNRDYAKHLGKLNEASEMLDARAMFELTGSKHYVSGLYTPGTTMLQPAGYIRGLARGLRRDGVGIYEKAPALKIERQGESWKVSTSRHVVHAGKVILANNGHLESFGFAKQRLMHIFLYASMTVDLGADAVKTLGGQPRWGVTPSDPMGTTMRRIDTAQGGNRIVTRTCASFLPGMEPSEAGLQRAKKVHREKFNQRFPAMKCVAMEYSWAGHLCLSRNGVAVMRELEQNLFSACVQNGLGTARGTLTGIGAAELALGVTSDITRYFTAEAEPTRLPPPPLSTLGANLYLRLQEWKAGDE